MGLFENPNWDRPAPEPPSLEVGSTPRRRVSLPCGEVSYLRRGSGPAVLLVHGIPTSARLWEGLLGDLGRDYDCIAPDLLGLGESRPNPGVDLSSPGQAEMLVQLLDALGVEQVLLVLHDQGGAHGMQLMERAGERIRAVAFSNVVCYDNWIVPAISVLMRAARYPAALGALGRSRLLEGPFTKVWPFKQTVVRGPVPTALGDDWFAQLRAGGPDLAAWCRYVTAQSPRYTVEAVPTLRSWTKPAFVMWAAHDIFLLPSWGARLAADLPTAPKQPVLLPFAGHFYQADVPRTAASVLGDFLADVPD
jgi:pimeloyl-ACP methyl ester carboxylesterase